MQANIYFPVEERPVFAGILEEATCAPSHKAIVRADTNEVLGIHSNKYKLVKNEDVFPVLEDVMSKCFDLNGMTTYDRTDKQGARTLRTYMFPEHQIEIGRGDKVAFELKAANSYDGSHTFGLMAGGFRFACFNGMVIGSAMANVKKKHTQSLDIDFVIRSLEHAMEMYNDNAQMWLRWTNTLISNEQASSIIKEVSTGARMESELFNQWQLERRVLGSTAWAMYQVLTHWSTHTKARTNHGTALLLREAKVRSVLPVLEKLAA